jgi:hypothetical protein
VPEQTSATLPPPTPAARRCGSLTLPHRRSAPRKPAGRQKQRYAPASIEEHRRLQKGLPRIWGRERNWAERKNLPVLAHEFFYAAGIGEDLGIAGILGGAGEHDLSLICHKD